MKRNNTIGSFIIVSLLLAAANITTCFAAPPQAALTGVWNIQYSDGSEGTMKVEKNNFKLTIPAVGEIKGLIQERGDYFESILSDRRTGINFLYGYIKGDKIEGKLQESAPCTELKKAFQSGVVAVSAKSCQFSFTAVKK